MKVSHLIFLILAGLGLLFVWHQFKYHGGLGGLFNTAAS